MKHTRNQNCHKTLPSRPSRTALRALLASVLVLVWLSPPVSANEISLRFGGDIPCVGIVLSKNGQDVGNDDNCGLANGDALNVLGIESDWYFIGELTYTDSVIEVGDGLVDYVLQDMKVAFGNSYDQALTRFNGISTFEGDYFGPYGTLIAGAAGVYDDGYDSVRILDDAPDQIPVDQSIDGFKAQATHEGEFFQGYDGGDPNLFIHLLEDGLNGDSDIFRDTNVKDAFDLGDSLDRWDTNFFAMAYFDPDGRSFSLSAPIDWIIVPEPSTLTLALLALAIGLGRRPKAGQSLSR